MLTKLVTLFAAFAVTAAAILPEIASKNGASFSLELSSCNNGDCIKICRALGFNHGSCNGNVCECSNLTHEVSNTLKDCNLRACEQTCRRLGFTGGVCVGDRCKCDNFMELKDSSHSLELSSCDNSDCIKICRALGFNHGSCNGNVCECSNLTHEVSNTLKDCNLRACEQTCRGLGFTGGVCVGDRCKCDNFMELKVSSHSLELSSCDNSDCIKICRALGFNHGSCNGNVCECSNLTHEVSNTLKDCNLRACEQTCRGLGFTGGVCVGDRCKCDNFVSIPAEITDVGFMLDFSACNKICRALGFHRGSCDGNVCECTNNEGLFFAGAAQGQMPEMLTMVSARATPAAAVLAVALLSLLYLTVSDIYALINYVGFATWLSIGAAVLCIPVLRYTKPELERPIKVNLFFPIIYIICTILVVAVPALASPAETGVGCLMILTAVPVYLLLLEPRTRIGSLGVITDGATHLVQKLTLSVRPKTK